MLKKSIVTGVTLRPLYSIISGAIKNIDKITYHIVRIRVIEAIDEINKFKHTFNNLSPINISDVTVGNAIKGDNNSQSN